MINLTALHVVEDGHSEAGTSINDISGALIGPINNGHTIVVELNCTQHGNAACVHVWSDDAEGGKLVSQQAILLEHWESECANCRSK